MAISTLTEIKQLNQTTGTSYDTLISTLIPICESEIFEYCQNHFVQSDIRLSGNQISFSSGTTPTITNANTGSSFVSESFCDGIHINILGSKHNDGNYLVDTVTASVITLDCSEELTSESAENDITITKVTYPKALKLVLSQMIKYRIQKYTSGISSESIDNYSVTFDAGNLLEYPNQILLALNKYRRVGWD
jgi:hypothetical protein